MAQVEVACKIWWSLSDPRHPNRVPVAYKTRAHLAGSPTTSDVSFETGPMEPLPSAA